MIASGMMTVQGNGLTSSNESLATAKRSPRRRGGWTLKRKLWLTLALMWIGMLAIVISMSLQSRQIMYADRQHALEDTVGMAQTLLQGYFERVENSEMSQAEAQAEAIKSIAAMRFGKDRDNYVFIVNDARRIVYHPRRDAGTDMSSYQDPNGSAIYQEMVAVANKNDSGYVKTVSKTSDSSTYFEKLCYVERFEPWGWNVVAGVYLTDIQEAFISQLIRYALLLLLVGSLVTVAFILVVRNVYSSLGGEPRAAVDVVGRIADGDLTQPTPLRTGDTSSLMHAIERMRSELAATIARIRHASESIDNGTREIATGNNDLSARTEEQAASLAETAASMEQLTSTVSQNADNAGQANRLAAQTTESVASGQEVISRVVTTMGDIRESSGKIADIITLIDGIAFQTNLLALNASLEAARAGEQGRGFAVVASEVRNLAGRSAEAASDIKALIESSVGQVNTGAKLVDQADNAMSEIRDSAQRVSDLMGEISAASHEQSSGIEQVSQAVTQMDQVTQQNAALVQQAAAAAGSLEDQSGQLYEAVARFRVVGNA